MRHCAAASLRAAALAAALATAGLAPAAAAAADARPPHVVQDPYYGDVLFYFFQDHYFSSLTRLMVAQHFERLTHHADEAEVLRGGLLLSFGLHREAGEVFDKLIASGAPPPVRDRAWYYLAKIRYQRGLPVQAEQALGHIEQPLPPDLEEDRGLLQANLLMGRGDYAGAARVLQAMPGSAASSGSNGGTGGSTGSALGRFFSFGSSSARGAPSGTGALYVRYNLGVALIKSGDVAGGSALLEQIGKAPATTDETRSLRDKANLALGFAALQDNQPAAARDDLERIRLNGMLANKALLGFGWAAVALNQPKEALVPWTELAQRDISDSAVLEAKLAVPYALAELGAYGQALDRYNEAIAAYAGEGVRLDESVAAIRSGKLLDGLLALNPGDEMGWFWNIDTLPEMPHGAHLALVLAQHDFQEGFKNYRDLQLLSLNLKEWEGNLAAFGDMLANRRQAYAERLPVVRGREHALGISTLEQRRDDLTAELAQVAAQGDGAAFADARERELGARLARVRAILEQPPASLGERELAEARERYRRVAGALDWQLTDEFAPRLWEARKGIGAVQAGLSDVRSRDAALLQALRDEPARSDAFAARILELDRRLHALMPRVAELLHAQQDYVQELAVAELVHQKDRLERYTNQARFAVAQLYDRANSSAPGTPGKPNPDGGNAPKP